MQARHYAHFKGEDKGSGPRCRLRPQSRWKMKVFAVVFTTETKACRVLLTESLLLAFPAFGNLEINRNGRRAACQRRRSHRIGGKGAILEGSSSSTDRGPRPGLCGGTARGPREKGCDFGGGGASPHRWRPPRDRSSARREPARALCSRGSWHPQAPRGA